jgi:hypothetical protein
MYWRLLQNFNFTKGVILSEAKNLVLSISSILAFVT